MNCFSSSSGAKLNGVTISTGSTYTAALGTTTEIDSAITNQGNLQINGGSGNNTIVNLGSDTTLSGGGTVTMSVASGGGSAFLRGSNFTLTNTDNTIQGAGLIGDSGALTVVNRATIDANASGQGLNLNQANGGVTNTNLLEATNSGTLNLFNTITNTGGNITAAGSGSIVNVFGTITGGTLNTSGGGVMESVGGSAKLAGVTVSTGSTYTAALGTTTELDGTITNMGTIQINGGSGNNTIVNLGSDVTLRGGGAVTLNVAGGGGSTFLRGSGVTLTNSDNTIQGPGNIGDSGALTIVNDTLGTIDANAGGALSIGAAGGPVTNNGTLQVDPGSTMVVHSTLTNFSGNTLTGGAYIVNGATGMTATMQLSSLGNNVAGEVVNNAADIVLNGPTSNTVLVDAGGNSALKPLAANATSNSSLTLEGGYSFTTVGAFSNAGAVKVPAASSLTVGPGGVSFYTQSGGLTKVNGTLTAQSGVTINGGTLDGVGTINSSVQNIAAQ
jgi:fibronectin-binding autotransporter adhesin